MEEQHDVRESEGAQVSPVPLPPLAVLLARGAHSVKPDQVGAASQGSQVVRVFLVSAAGTDVLGLQAHQPVPRLLPAPVSLA